MFIQMEQNKQLKIYAKYLEIENEKLLSQLQTMLQKRDSLKQERGRLQSSRSNFVEDMINIKRLQLQQIKSRSSAISQRLTESLFSLKLEQEQNERLNACAIKLNDQLSRGQSVAEYYPTSNILVSQQLIQVEEKWKQKIISSSQGQTLTQCNLIGQVSLIKNEQTLIKKKIDQIQNKYQGIKSTCQKVGQFLSQGRQVSNTVIKQLLNYDTTKSTIQKQRKVQKIQKDFSLNQSQLSSKISIFRSKLTNMNKSQSSKVLLSNRKQDDFHKDSNTPSKSTLTLNLSTLAKNTDRFWQPKSERIIKNASTSQLSRCEIEKLDLKRRIAELQIEMLKSEENESERLHKVEAKNKQLRRTLQEIKRKNVELHSKLLYLKEKNLINEDDINFQKTRKRQVVCQDLCNFVKSQKKQIEQMKIVKSKGFGLYEKQDIPLIESLQGSKNEILWDKDCHSNRELSKIECKQEKKDNAQIQIDLRQKMGGEKRVGKGSADIIMLIKLMKEKNSVLRKEIG